jgi:hypothetical protein
VPSFHPKLVLIRFVREGAPDRLRAVCMSRNLTGDAALDAGVVIDGEVADGVDDAQGTQRLAGALERVLGWTVRADQRAAADGLVRELAGTVRRTRWQLPEGFRTVAFLPLGMGETGDPAAP